MDGPSDSVLAPFPDATYLLRVVVRLGMAVVLGGVLGYERERGGKHAGLRTHILVALGAALFTLVPAEAGVLKGEFGRIVQGVAAGIGFLGAGTILKLSEQQQVKGLTSAAGIWLTAAIGMAAGAGIFWPAILGVLLAWVVLTVIGNIEVRMGRRENVLAVAPPDRPRDD